jgi:hypothetical protein
MAVKPVKIQKLKRGVMRIRSVFPIAVIVAGFMASAAVYAAPNNVPSTVRVAYSKTKTVKVALRNDSSSQMQLKVGEEVVSLDPGKTVAVKVPVGTRIVVNEATSTHQAGELIAEATTALDNSTVAIK